MSSTTVSQYLIQRLSQLGINTLFTVPGENIAPFLRDVEKDKSLRLINSTTEQECAFSADAVGKCSNGKPGCFTVNFGNGSLQVLNAITGSYVEDSPVIFINGAPSMKKYYQTRDGGVLRNSRTTYGNWSEIDMFRKVTIQSERIDEAYLAPFQIDQTLTACITRQKPVYLEIPEDIWHLKCPVPQGKIVRRTLYSDELQLERAVKEILHRWNNSKNPLIWAGLEISRFDAVNSFKSLLEKSEAFYTTDLTSKGLINERNEKFVGVYTGKSSSEGTLNAFEKADLILAIGVTLTDIDMLSMSLEDLEGKTIIFVSKNSVKVDHFHASQVSVKDVIDRLVKRIDSKEIKIPISTFSSFTEFDFQFNETSELTYDTAVTHIRQSKLIQNGTVLIGDTSLSVFPLSNVRVGEGQFLSGIGWSSKGYSLGGAVGVHVALKKKPIVFCGDGCFQSNSQALSTLVQMKADAVIFVFNNQSLNIGQWVMNPKVFKDETPIDPWNVISKWGYSTFMEALGGTGFIARDHGELAEVLKMVEKTNGVCLVDLRIPQKNVPESVKWKFDENK
jgi:indolepyruvate decarboxylase